MAFAQENDVIVLEVRSIEGDDDFAHNLSRAIRQAAGDVEGWNVSGREVSLTQMALAFGCEGEEPDAGCMSQIASDLEMDGIIYGTIQRTSAGSSYQYELRLRYYNARTTQIEQPISDTLSRAARSDDMLDKARRWVARFAGREQGGGLRLVVNVPGAEVSIDGVPAGEADDNGVFTSQNVAVGQREVEVSAPGYRGFRATVTVTSGEVFELEVDLEEGSGVVDGGGGGGDGPSIWPALTLYGVAAISAAVWILSFAKVRQAQDDEQFMQYRELVPMGDNACTDADMGFDFGSPGLRVNAVNVCDDWKRFRVLAFVFGGLTIASAVGGTVLLFRALNGGDDDEEEPPGALSFGASVGRRSGFLNAQLSF
jgi:hypothetical protein